MADWVELACFCGRAFDADAQDRELREPSPQPLGLPQAQARRRLEQHEFGLLALSQLPLADRSITEPQDEKLEQRPRSRIGIGDQDRSHASRVADPCEIAEWQWYELGMNDPRILVADDDEDIRRLVRTLLEKTGATVHDAADGREALREFHDWRPDLVLLDVSMPELDGWQVLERIRDLSDCPVLMLTARGDELERVRGLQGGADDYVVKPFGRQEFVARVQALLRRAGRVAEGDVVERYADSYLTIDYPQRRIMVRDREVRLTPLEFRLLSTLVRNSRQVLSREQLLGLVWGDTYGVGGDQVKLYIGYLRRKLEPKPSDVTPIETVRGFGYRYAPPPDE